MKLMRYEDRMCVFAPASESVVGDNDVDVTFFDDGLNLMMFLLKIHQCSWYGCQQLENLRVAFAVYRVETRQFYYFNIRKSFLKERKRSFVGDNDRVMS